MQAFYEAHDIKQKKPYIFHPLEAGFHSHWHENVEILYFHETCNLVCDRNEFTVNAGEFAIIGSDVPHTLECRTIPFYECLIIDSSFCFENGMDVRRLDFETGIDDKILKAKYDKLLSEIKEEKSFYEAGTKASILELMVYLCRNYSRERAENDNRDDNIKKAIMYINSNFNKSMTVDEISSHATLSKYYFCHEFKKVTGYSVVQYINTIRCRAAERMLATKKCTVSEAAAATGYDNLSYFTRTFKSITGHLPGEYKKNRDEAGG